MLTNELLDEKIALAPYDPQWIKFFQAEALRIKTTFNERIRDIQHIGSTVIPNMDAKPIVAS